MTRRGWIVSGAFGGGALVLLIIGLPYLFRSGSSSVLSPIAGVLVALATIVAALVGGALGARATELSRRRRILLGAVTGAGLYGMIGSVIWFPLWYVQQLMRSGSSSSQPVWCPDPWLVASWASSWAPPADGD
jgi:quinol-cytochrome oxidoreductase complex cytochrome b subunit